MSTLHFLYLNPPLPAVTRSLNSPEDGVVDHDLLWFDPHLHSPSLTGHTQILRAERTQIMERTKISAP